MAQTAKVSNRCVTMAQALNNHVEMTSVMTTISK